MLFFLVFLTCLLSFVSLNGDFFLIGEGFGCSSLFYPLSLVITSFDIWVLGMLLFCGILALWFCSHYFGWSPQLLYMLIIFFLCVMGFLVLSGDFLLGLVGWEYLGFVSFILILYYACYDTAYAANVTLISSRFGDVGFFIICGLVFINLLEVSPIIASLSFALIILTKSAVAPFSSWLLEAMRAPTPVSCLVHSSTLVAAGVWFMASYGVLIEDSILFICCMFCIYTVIASAWCALYFSDVKKIVALSTCNNIAWCLFYYICGFKLLCIAQLVSHGIAKCLLFMGVDDILAGSYSSQNLKSLYGLNINSGMGWFGTVSLILIIAGVPFHGVFFTKHFLLIEMGINYNSLLLISTLYGIYLSYLYSSRLICIVVFKHGVLLNWISSIFVPICLVIIISSILNFYFSTSFIEGSLLSAMISVSVIFIQVFGLLLGVIYSFFNKDLFWYNNFMGQDLLIKILFNIWGYLLLLVPIFQVRWEVWLVILNATGLKQFFTLNLFSGLFISFSMLCVIMGILYNSINNF
uniref:NADH:ubiquinone reductase (H(+)-translocating) n=1 Tax=Dactylogyrus lamellatus TaxID=231327 RepID=A0A342K3V0_9PLAT|nr:NADH dehydrogenase subunit 5 [Dactylogyrus lamellatus]ALP29094.1 NADH dehydrogenase subunit 5 [Dactylogyrus lamellatus]